MFQSSGKNDLANVLLKRKSNFGPLLECEEAIAGIAKCKLVGLKINFCAYIHIYL